MGTYEEVANEQEPYVKLEFVFVLAGHYMGYALVPCLSDCDALFLNLNFRTIYLLTMI